VLGLDILNGLLRTRGTKTYRNLTGLDESLSIEREGELPTVLCIHGFTGVPFEVKAPCDVAVDLGLAAKAPLLVGHGTSPTELAPLRFDDWLSGVREVFNEARARGPVILVGLSLGSLLATQLALEAPGAVAGLVLLSSAFWLHHPHPGLSLQMASALGLPDFFLDKGGPDLACPHGYRDHISYDTQPLHAAISLYQAGKRLADSLFLIHCPTLIMHGAYDHVCPVHNAWKTAARLGTRDSRVIILPRSQHIITCDCDRDQLCAELRAFFQRVSQKIETSQSA